MYRDESREAWQSSDRKKIKEQIILYFRSKPSGSTADEVAADFDLTTHNYTSPEISHMQDAGLLIPTGEKRTTRSGRKAAVLVLADDMRVGKAVFRFGWERRHIVVDGRQSGNTEWRRAPRRFSTLSEAREWIESLGKKSTMSNQSAA